MYDAKMEANEFVGESREEAVAKACGFYGLDEDGLKIAEAEEALRYAGTGADDAERARLEERRALAQARLDAS